MKRLKPAFWDYRAADSGSFKNLFNFRRIWKLAVILTACVAIVPLIVLAIVDLNVTKHSTEDQITLRISKLVSNTERSVSFFLEERKYALHFIVKSNSFEKLIARKNLASILESLKQTIGGFTDLGVIDASGKQIRYVGPYDLEDKNYRNEEWFREVLERGLHISDAFLGFREVPHIVIAVKHNLPDGSYYVFRTTLDTERFNKILSQLERTERSDVFLINSQGIIQTPTAYHGDVLTKLALPVPAYSDTVKVVEYNNVDEKSLTVGYAYIKDSPFILMIVAQKDDLMKSWTSTSLVLVSFLAISITLILLVVVGVATRLVNEIYLADQKRAVTLAEAEHSAKLASIGRLAAGVAHEINNPLAIIGEKAGLMKDLLSLKDANIEKNKLTGLADAILASVDRCAAITIRLLGFAQHLKVSVELVDIKGIIDDVLSFLNKEANYRSIEVKVDIPENIHRFVSDRGKLQQIFLNLANNAFAAMKDGGHLQIQARITDEDHVSIAFIDDGCGIAAADLERVFDPFFTTRKEMGGTGLGLSITYGIVQELGGNIEIRSELGKGARFTVTLPIKRKYQEA
jgi:two-component system, NtrC family, sensor kinase